jgi:putative glycosyltransferase
MKLSIVSTLYQSANEIRDFYLECTAVATQFAGDDYEIILVNDGSPDNSYDIVLEIAQQDLHVVLIDLSRNFGQHKALMTGLSFTRGDVIMWLDSDLEEDPRWLMEFYTVMQQHQHDTVVGVQISRRGALVERFTGELFYRMFHWMGGFKFPNNSVAARLMTRRFVDALLLHKEKELFFDGLSYITGFSHGFVSVNKKSSSATSYTMRRKIALAVNAVTSFSDMPLHFISYAGIALFLFAALAIVYLIYMRISHNDITDGWTSLLVAVIALGGLQLSALGVIGLYIAKIFIETKNRPFTIIRSVYNQKYTS